MRSIWLAGGATVAVLESESVGWGASGRNGGMTTSGMALRLRVAIQRYGFETAQSLYQAYNDAIDTVEKVITTRALTLRATVVPPVRGHLPQGPEPHQVTS